MGCRQVVRQWTLTPSSVGSNPPIPVFDNFMNAYIEFLEGIPEKSLPFIKLTKSKNGKTGTATFVFHNPSIFTCYSSFSPIDGMSLIWDNNKIRTTDLQIIYKDGKPFFFKSIFILKNSYEWFQFLNFMTSYSKETGLFFSENN